MPYTFKARLGYSPITVEAIPAAATLREAVLKAYSLGVSLQGVDLQGVDLQGVDLQGVDLQGVDLRGAYLRGAYLQGVDLQGVDLRGAYLRGVDLQGAHLQGVDLRGAYLQGEPGEVITAASTVSTLIGVATHPYTAYDCHAFRMADGSVFIKWGCRCKTLSEYREHVTGYADTAKGKATTAVLNLMEALAAIQQEEEG